MNSDPPEELEFFLALTLAASKAWPLVRREFAAAGVDPGNWGLLFHVGARERITPSQLAAETGVTATTMRDQVQAFVDRGLLRREPNPRDARSYLVGLTRKGQRELERGLAASRLARDAVAAELGDVEPLRRCLLELIRRLGALDELAEADARARHVADVLHRRSGGTKAR